MKYAKSKYMLSIRDPLDINTATNRLNFKGCRAVWHADINPKISTREREYIALKAESRMVPNRKLLFFAGRMWQHCLLKKNSLDVCLLKTSDGK